MKKISIIVPVYQTEIYLEKCIKSIQNQTYHHLEIILIDDGSTDNSGKLCEKFALEDPRIKVIHKENEGLSATRNLGIEMSTGDYITFVDSDDWISEDYCQTLVDAIEKTNSDVSVIKFALVVEKNAVITNVSPERTKVENGSIVFEGEEIIKELLTRKILESYVCGKLFKASLVKNNQFVVGVTYEDNIFSYDTLESAEKVVYVDKECYFYLKHKGTITATCSEKNLLDFINAVMYRFQDVEKRHSDLTVYNYFALLEKIISITIKYVIANDTYEIVERELNKMFHILKEYVKINENQIFPLLNDFQKICLYLIIYDIDLYYSFLKERQKMKKEGKVLK